MDKVIKGFNWERFSGVVGMLASSYPAERLNAAELALKMLEGANLTWGDVIAAAERGAQPSGPSVSASPSEPAPWWTTPAAGGRQAPAADPAAAAERARAERERAEAEDRAMLAALLAKGQMAPPMRAAWESLQHRARAGALSAVERERLRAAWAKIAA